MQQNLHPVQFQPVYKGQYGSARVSSEGYVSDLRVKEGERRRGHGSGIMRQITGDADKFGHGLTLHARPDLGEFYEKHGFTRTGADYMGGTAMVRWERKPKEIEGI